MDEEGERFYQALNNSYGQMESVMGSGAYEAFLHHREAEVRALESLASRQRAIAAAISLVSLVGLLMAMPVLVWLWRWALS